MNEVGKGKWNTDNLEQPADHIVPSLLCPVRLPQLLRSDFRIIFLKNKATGQTFANRENKNLSFLKRRQMSNLGLLIT